MSALTLSSAACGALTGAVLALSGAGGGILAVPLLVLVVGVPIQAAGPVSLIAVAAGAWLGAFIGWRQGVLRYRAAGLIGLAGAVAAPTGLWLAHRLPPAPLLAGFAAVLLWTAWRMVGQAASAEPAPAGRPCLVDPARGRLRWTAPCAWSLAGTGAVSGLLSGLLGVGGGFVIVPALSRFTDLTAQGIVATSLAVVALVATTGVAAASHTGGIPWPVAWPFGVACVASLAVVRTQAGHIPPSVIRRSFALLCVLAAGMLLARMGGFAPG